MDNEILVKNADSAITPTVQQTGNTNLNVTNENGGFINFNITYQHSTPEVSANQLMTIQSFSKEYYQLIVTCEDDVFDNNIVTVSVDRALTKYSVPAEIFDRCSTLSEEGKAELMRFPAIICRENTKMRGETDPNQWATFAYIKKIQVAGKSVKIAFQPIASLQQKKLCDKRNAVFFDLNMDCAITDLNHSAWSVHKVNVFEALDEAGIPGIPRPV
ncbi:MAG: hypothetical protein RR415_12970 [Ruthenibacterium sp.]